MHHAPSSARSGRGECDLQAPDRVQLFRRPELEEGEAGFTQTATELLRRCGSHGLPGGHQKAPARGRGGYTVER
jgi:hypothetical protein